MAAGDTRSWDLTEPVIKDLSADVEELKGRGGGGGGGGDMGTTQLQFVVTMKNQGSGAPVEKSSR